MLHDLTIHAAADLLRSGEISSVQLTEALIDRITDVDNDVKAYLTLLPELALEQAAESDRAIAARARRDRWPRCRRSPASRSRSKT